MSSSRRGVHQFVVAGSVAPAVPLMRHFRRAESKSAAAARSRRTFEICHQLRDGHHSDRPDARARSHRRRGRRSRGLSALIFWRQDWLLLEKDLNSAARSSGKEFEGEIYGPVGYASRGPRRSTRSEIGLNCPSSTCPTHDREQDLRSRHLETGLDQLPSEEVRESFKKFRTT